MGRKRHKNHKKNHFMADYGYQNWKEKHGIQPSLSSDYPKMHLTKRAKKRQKQRKLEGK